MTDNVDQTVALLVCPADRQALRRDGENLRCERCSTVYPVWRGVPFVCRDHSLEEVTEGTQRNVSVHGTNAADEFSVYAADRVADRIDLPAVRRWLKFFLRDFGREFSGKRILDLGAGRCDYSLAVAEACPSARLVAIDLIPTRLAEMLARPSPSNLSFVAGSAYSLPFADRSFDVVYGSMILHHLVDLPKVASEVARVLRPGGVYLGAEPNLGSPVGWLGFTLAHKSTNEYPIREAQIRDAFSAHGLKTRIRYFWRRSFLARTRRTGTCLAIEATRP